MDSGRGGSLPWSDMRKYSNCNFEVSMAKTLGSDVLTGLDMDNEDGRRRASCSRYRQFSRNFRGTSGVRNRSKTYERDK